MLVVVATMVMVEVSAMQIVRMVIVLYCDMSAAWRVLMITVFVGTVTSHGSSNLVICDI